MVAQSQLPQGIGSLFGQTFLSSKSIAMSLRDTSSASKEAAQIQGLDAGRKVEVKISLDSTLTASAGTNWKDRAACGFYDATAQKWAFSGCELSDTQETYLKCKCDHLTEFTAMIDPDRPVCGDGIVKGVDEEQQGADGTGVQSFGCDDGNRLDGDGCSSSCKVEDTSVCWQVPRPDDATQKISKCCAPCEPGFVRSGCVKFSGENGGTVSTGECVECAAGKYKVNGIFSPGRHDDLCLDCASPSTVSDDRTQCITWGSLSPYATCTAGVTWKDILGDRAFYEAHSRTGGLGYLMQEEKYESWWCIDAHVCAPPGDYFCFVWDEVQGQFVPWAPNSKLGLIPGPPPPPPTVSDCHRAQFDEFNQCVDGLGAPPSAVSALCPLDQHASRSSCTQSFPCLARLLLSCWPCWRAVGISIGAMHLPSPCLRLPPVRLLRRYDE